MAHYTEQLANVGDALTIDLPDSGQMTLGIQTDVADAGDTHVFEGSINNTDWNLVTFNPTPPGPGVSTTGGGAGIWINGGITISALRKFRIRKTVDGGGVPTTVHLTTNTISSPSVSSSRL